MKKYQLLTQDGYDEQYFRINEIYDEDYLGGSKETPVKILVEVFPRDWQSIDQEEEQYLTDDMYCSSY